MKITSADVMTRVPVRLSRLTALLFPQYTGKCLVSRTLHYVSISLFLASHSNAFFSLFGQSSLKIKY